MDSESTSATSLVSVVFCDVVGSTELRVRLGDDRADTLNDHVSSMLRRCVEHHRGQVVKELGDGSMSVFRSVAAAVASAADMHRGAHALDPSVRLRIGVAVGETAEERGDWFGTPVVTAARLCAAAATDAILVDDLVVATLGSRGGFAFAANGLLRLKGLPREVSTSTVDWRSVQRAPRLLPESLVAARRTLMVGRDDELREANNRFSESGDSYLVVSGELGAGKSRFVAEVVATCLRDEVDLEFVTCSADGGAVPRLDSLAGLGTDADPATIATALRGRAEKTPLALVVDDAEWLDLPSASTLRALMQTTSTGLSIIATYDHGANAADAFSAALAYPTVSTMHLNGLSEAAITTLLSSDGTEPSAAFVRELAERTSGNALFVAEYTRSHTITVEGLTAVPDSVRGVIEQRLSRLGEECTHLLRVASVIGRTFSAELASDVLSRTLPDVLDLLDAAEHADLVESAGDFEYQFRHAVHRDVLLADVSPARRLLIERQLANLGVAPSSPPGVTR